jgi:CBS domain-containing protein
MLVLEILERKGRDVVTTEPDATVEGLARLLAERRIGAVLVVSGEQILGVVSERDIIHAIATHGPRALALTVAEVMSANLEVCNSEDRIDAIMARMTDRRIRHVPVVDGHRLVGIVSIGDVVKHRVEEVEAEAHMLRDYVEMR